MRTAARVLRTPLALVVVFAAVAGLAIAHHEMWMDELNPWDIARDAHSLAELFRNMRFEEHPAAWYLMLYGLTRFTANPIAMQILHLGTAVLVVALIAWVSPFTPAEKWLLAFGYFFLYEYAVVSRAYGLGVLLLFSACALQSRRTSPWIVACCLALCANTTVYGMFLASAFGIGFAVGRIVDGPPGTWRGLVGPALVVVGGAALGLAVAYPSSEMVFGRGWHLAFDGARLSRTLNLIWAAYVPLPIFTARSPWNSSIVADALAVGPAAGPVLAVAAAGLITLAGVALRRSPGALTAYLLSTLIVFAFVYLKFTDGLRHHGHLFIAFVAALWMARASSRSGPAEAREPTRAEPLSGLLWQGPVLEGLLALQVVAALFFVVQDIRRPFSFSEDLTHFVAGLPRPATIAVAQNAFMNYSGPVVSGYLREPLDYVLAHSTVRMSFAIWDAERLDRAREGEILAQVRRLANDRGTDVYVITNNWRPHIIGRHLAHFGAGLEGDERSADVYLFEHDAPGLKTGTSTRTVSATHRLAAR